MVGNVGGIVESYFAADNAKSQHTAAASRTGGRFSDYLDYALLNSRSGILFGNGLDSGYSYMNGLSNSIWQSMVLKALKEELQKDSDAKHTDTSSQEETAGAKTEAKKKPDWAAIRVIKRYNSPVAQEAHKGMTV